MPEQPPNLEGCRDIPRQHESLDGQRELFTTGRTLPKKARKDYERGQDFLFGLEGQDDDDNS